MLFYVCSVNFNISIWSVAYRWAQIDIDLFWYAVIMFIIINIVSNAIIFISVIVIITIPCCSVWRLKWKVELVMDVQQALPISIWRRAVVRYKIVTLDNTRFGLLKKYYQILTGEDDLLKEAIKVTNKETEEVRLCLFIGIQILHIHRLHVILKHVYCIHTGCPAKRKGGFSVLALSNCLVCWLH